MHVVERCLFLCAEYNKIFNFFGNNIITEIDKHSENHINLSKIC